MEKQRKPTVIELTINWYPATPTPAHSITRNDIGTAWLRPGNEERGTSQQTWHQCIFLRELQIVRRAQADPIDLCGVPRSGENFQNNQTRQPKTQESTPDLWLRWIRSWRIFCLSKLKPDKCEVKKGPIDGLKCKPRIEPRLRKYNKRIMRQWRAAYIAMKLSWWDGGTKMESLAPVDASWQ